MSDLTSTLSTGEMRELEAVVPEARGRLGLAIAWSLDEPERVGEIFLPTELQTTYILGRHTCESSLPTLRPHRIRPQQSAPRPPLQSRRISREQLQVRACRGALEVENVGQCPMLYQGRELGACALGPGEVLTLKNQLVLLCVRCPPMVLLSELGQRLSFGEADEAGMVGESAEMWTLREQIAFAAARTNHILLLGESGTGKELMARAIHARSSRSTKLLVSRNAVTIPESLFDAELFGNVRDYPNPGMPERPGLVGQADGSTLFLDEIGELPHHLQAHLLRFLDRGGEYHKLGESVSRRSALRLIAATNRSPEALRRDLLARFAVHIHLPSLNSRREDIPFLIRYLLHRAAECDPRVVRFLRDDPHQSPRLAPGLIEKLITHHYTYHVRELESLLWSAIATSPDNWLRLTPALNRQMAISASHPAVSRESPVADESGVSRAAIEAALERTQGNVSQAWKELGLSSRYVLRRLLKKHQISADRWRKS